VGEIETALALGADTNSSVVPKVQTSFEAGLIPAIDSLRSLGIVWIPAGLRRCMPPSTSLW
jgi:putative ABC transport system permease protein